MKKSEKLKKLRTGDKKSSKKDGQIVVNFAVFCCHITQCELYKLFYKQINGINGKLNEKSSNVESVDCAVIKLVRELKLQVIVKKCISDKKVKKLEENA